MLPHFLDLTKCPGLDPSEEELKKLLDNIRVFNDDLADNSGAVHLEAGEDKRVTLARHPVFMLSDISHGGHRQ